MGATAITAIRKPHKEENRISIHLYGYRISQKKRIPLSPDKSSIYTGNSSENKTSESHTQISETFFFYQRIFK